MNYHIRLALVVVIATVWALIKRYDTKLTLLIGGLAMCCVSLDPMMAFRQFDKSMTTGALIISVRQFGAKHIGG